MPARHAPLPIEAGLSAEERAVMIAALSAAEVAHRYAAELEDKTPAGKARRLELFHAAQIAGRLCERLLL